MPGPPAPSLRMAPRPKYRALATAALQRAIAYRGTTLLSLLSGLVWVAVLYYLWRTVYADRPRLGSFDWRQMRTYILVSYAVSALISFSSSARILSAIRTGDVAINLATNCIAFWEPSSSGSFPFMVQNFLEFAKFPLSLYDRFVQGLVTWVLPFAFVSYYPGTTLLDKPVSSPWLGYLAPLAGPAVALITALIWRTGLRRYQGTGH